MTCNRSKKLPNCGIKKFLSKRDKINTEEYRTKEYEDPADGFVRQGRNSSFKRSIFVLELTRFNI